MERIVFSIDNWYSLYPLSKFLRHMETQRITNKLKGEFKVLQGCYQGEPELSFMCSRVDFESFVIPLGWVDNQESVLIIHPDNTTFLKFRHSVEYLGTWTNISETEKGESWTYEPKDKTWWTCT